MRWLLILLLVSFPLGHLTRIELASGIALYPHDIITTLMLMLVIRDAVATKKLPDGYLTKPIILFIGAAVVSLISGSLAVEPIEIAIGSLYLIRWIAISGVYFWLVKYKKERKYLFVFGNNYTFIEALLISGLTAAAFGLVQYLLVPDLTQLKWLGWDDHYYRLTGTILDPGFMGILLILTFFLALSSKLQNSVKFLALGLPLVSLALTYSRASYLAFIGGFLVYMYQLAKWKFGISVASLFILALTFLPNPGGEGVNLKRTFSLVSRAQTWSNALIITQDQPLFGVGFNLLRFAKHRYGFISTDWKTSHSGAGVENSFLFLLATTGVVGFCFYLWLLYKMVHLGINKLSINKEQGTALLASIAAVSIHSLFNNTWFYPWVMVWMWVLLATSEVKSIASGTTARK